MVRKKVEGDEDQRRRAALDAERAGRTPSGQGRTTGGSKQRTHVPGRHSLTHEEKTAPVHRGKQGDADRFGGERREEGPARTFEGRGHPAYGQNHERVFAAVADAERTHGAPHLDEVARAAGLGTEEARVLLHDLVSVHGLLAEVQGGDTPDQGPRYETKPRR
ncbi:hypothetical protein V1J52_22390 [Streptomyces sp. TRM 70351]|uniref:hypothetical protein n=1 Tax=Streptomyces sp. TRM 70351 TaxID=3116552 RepID=UPI002E7AD432|nr:hypothetical protein [Streptomyces sp. TRM 70351]MEE1930897.1 hypothetical protein [Streptomyces sp. TRM 70351]